MGIFGAKTTPDSLQNPPSTLFQLLERAVFALERLAGVGKGGFRAPGAPGTLKTDVSYVDDAEMAILEMRRAAYEHRTGKPLADDEEPPRIPEEEELKSLFVEPGKG